MKFIVDCKSLLLQKALEEFLKGYISDDGVVISDEPFGDIVIGKDIKKPFTRSQLLLQLEKVWEIKKAKIKKIKEERNLIIKKEKDFNNNSFLEFEITADEDNEKPLFDENGKSEFQKELKEFEEIKVEKEPFSLSDSDDSDDVDYLLAEVEKEKKRKEREEFEKKIDNLINEFNQKIDILKSEFVLKIKNLIKEEYDKEQY